MFSNVQKNGKECFGTRKHARCYVDDFKLAAKHGEHDALWAAIRGVIDMDPETQDGRVPGCSLREVHHDGAASPHHIGQPPSVPPSPEAGGRRRTYAK